MLIVQELVNRIGQPLTYCQYITLLCIHFAQPTLPNDLSLHTDTCHDNLNLNELNLPLSSPLLTWKHIHGEAWQLLPVISGQILSDMKYSQGHPPLLSLPPHQLPHLSGWPSYKLIWLACLDCHAWLRIQLLSSQPPLTLTLPPPALIVVHLRSHAWMPHMHGIVCVPILYSIVLLPCESWDWLLECWHEFSTNRTSCEGSL